MTVVVHCRTYFKAPFFYLKRTHFSRLHLFHLQVSERHVFLFRSCHWIIFFFSLYETTHCLLTFISYLEDKASIHAVYMINLKSMKVDWTHLKKSVSAIKMGQTASHDVLWIETKTTAWINVCKRYRKYICISLSIYITNQHLCTEPSMVLFVYALQLQE